MQPSDKPNDSERLDAMQTMIDQLYVISTRIDARIDGVVEILERILGEEEGPKLRGILVQHEYSRMDIFLLQVELAEPEVAQRMRHFFRTMMRREGKT